MKGEGTMKKHTLTILVAAVLMFGGSASAATINVTDWAGVIAATPNSGDTIQFPPGAINATSQVALVSGVIYQGDPGGTTIDCGGTTRAFTAWGDRETSLTPEGTGQTGWTLKDLKIINGQADAVDRDDAAGLGPITNPDKSTDAGAFRPGHGATGTIIGCTFENCKATADAGGQGGVIRTEGVGVTLTLTDCTFTGNEAGDDGEAIHHNSDGGDMTIETAIVKMMFLFGQFQSVETVRNNYQKSLAGEIGV